MPLIVADSDTNQAYVCVTMTTYEKNVNTVRTKPNLYSSVLITPLSC